MTGVVSSATVDVKKVRLPSLFAPSTRRAWRSGPWYDAISASVRGCACAAAAPSASKASGSANRPFHGAFLIVDLLLGQKPERVWARNPEAAKGVPRGKSVQLSEIIAY